MISVPPVGRTRFQLDENRAAPSGFASETNNKCQIKSKLLHKRGQKGQALGRSRGGFSTKIHLKFDFDGLPLTFQLTGGEASDSRNFDILLDIGPDITPRAVLGDKG